MRIIVFLYEEFLIFIIHASSIEARIFHTGIIQNYAIG
jgi:hypothetical protein